jgi:hypothetical protein
MDSQSNALTLVKGASKPVPFLIGCPRPGCSHVEGGREGEAVKALIHHIVTDHMQPPAQEGRAS